MSIRNLLTCLEDIPLKKETKNKKRKKEKKQTLLFIIILPVDSFQVLFPFYLQKRFVALTHWIVKIEAARNWYVSSIFHQAIRSVILS